MRLRLVMIPRRNQFRMKFAAFAAPLLAVVVLFGLAERASASIMKGDWVKVTRTGTGYGGAFGGGEFTLWKYNSSLQKYQKVGRTFCLEIDENIQLNTSFRVGSVSTRAVLGGANTNSGDDLDFATDLLYRKYAEQKLNNITLGDGSKFEYDNNEWNNALQRAIWVLEDEVSGFGNHSYSDKAEQLYNWAVGKNKTRYSGVVWALNLFSKYTSTSAINAFDPYDTSTWHHVAGKHKQDQLWYFDYPNNSAAIPEPTTIVIWLGAGLGGVGFGALRRRRRKDNRCVKNGIED